MVIETTTIVDILELRIPPKTMKVIKNTAVSATGTKIPESVIPRLFKR
jgi:hypothetical protein